MDIEELEKHLSEFLNKNKFDSTASKFFAELIYDYYSWTAGSYKSTKFEGKSELKNSLKEFLELSRRN
ncbi:hypothetical protein [Arcobacter aquimarinus]|uniref:hypothetical protein n=1 Tax=Arcobacter aquimarinus TaxID=1315211 RepID=UPI003BAFBAE3